MKSVTFDNGRGFALGYDEAAPSPFVTWQFTETENGQRDYYWGHYHSDGQTAEKDFAKRILLDKKQVTAKELAEYFEVSVRTIHRDLLDLSSAGFPVITQQGVGGGISLMPNFRYNKSALSKDDMDVILAGIQGLSIIDDSTKIKTLLAKLRFSSNDKMLLENDIVIDFSTWNHNSTIIKKYGLSVLPLLTTICLT